MFNVCMYIRGVLVVLLVLRRERGFLMVAIKCKFVQYVTLGGVGIGYFAHSGARTGRFFVCMSFEMIRVEVFGIVYISWQDP